MKEFWVFIAALIIMMYVYHYFLENNSSIIFLNDNNFIQQNNFCNINSDFYKNECCSLKMSCGNGKMGQWNSNLKKCQC